MLFSISGRLKLIHSRVMSQENLNKLFKYVSQLDLLQRCEVNFVRLACSLTIHGNPSHKVEQSKSS